MIKGLSSSYGVFCFLFLACLDSLPSDWHSSEGASLLYGLVVNMIEGVRPPSRLPTQVVAPMTLGEDTSDSGEDTSGVSSDEETSGTREDASTDSVGQSPPRPETPPQEESDSVIIIESDSDSESDSDQN